MAQQGAVLQNYNNELVKSLEELTRRRAHLNDQIKAETAEKSKLEAEKTKIEEKLFTVESSLEKKLTARAEYDKVIGDAEQVRCNIQHSIFNIQYIYCSGLHEDSRVQSDAPQCGQDKKHRPGEL